MNRGSSIGSVLAWGLGVGLVAFVLYKASGHSESRQRSRRSEEEDDTSTATATTTTVSDTSSPPNTQPVSSSPPPVSALTAPRLHVIVVDTASGRSPQDRASTATPSQLQTLSLIRSLSSVTDTERIIVQSVPHDRLSTDNWQTFTSAAVLPDVSAPSPDALAQLAAYAAAGGPVVVVGTGAKRLADVMSVSQPSMPVTDCTATLLEGDDASVSVTSGVVVCSVPCVPSSDEPAYNWRCILERLSIPVGAPDPTRPSPGFLVGSPDVCDSMWSSVRRSGKTTTHGGVCIDASSSSITVLPPDKRSAVTSAVDPSDPSALAIALCPVSNASQLESDPPSSTFNWTDFFRVLHTRCLGRTVLQWDAIGSTQTLLDRNTQFLTCVPNSSGLIVVANRQLAGRGRGSNAWISPKGSISVTVHQRLTAVPSSLVFYQYAVGLAMVEAVCDLRGFDAVPLRLKWPNDIYYAPETSDPKSWVKLGGVLVTCSSMGSTTDVMIGCGVNVTNPAPTVSLAQVLEQYNAVHGTALVAPSVEVLLARFLNRLEAVLHDLSTRGFPAIEDRYYSKWLHSNARVRVEGQPGPVIVRGVHHKTGELVADVQASSTGHPSTVLLSPGSCSFDILNGLLSRKQA